MKHVWKYPLGFNPLLGYNAINQTMNSKIVLVDEQHSQVCVWFEFDDRDEKSMLHRVHIIGTGHGFHPKLIHAGSVNTTNGFVWHVYYSKEKTE